MKRIFALLMTLVLTFSLVSCSKSEENQNGAKSNMNEQPSLTQSTPNNPAAVIPDGFVFINGGTFRMGSPDTEAWRSDDEMQHTVTVGDFYMSSNELTQKEYSDITGSNPSNFSGDKLPVENVSWMDAVTYCNARSEAERLEQVLYHQRCIRRLES